MNLEDMKGAIILLALISLIGAASAIALDDFRGDLVTGAAFCNSSHTSACSVAYNVTTNGLEGVDNTTSYLDTIGTIIGVAVLIGIVVLAFTFARR